MVRKDSEAYSMSEGIYVFLVLFRVLISCYQLFSNYVYHAIKNLFSRIYDISSSSEMISIRITCNTRHTILSYCFELKRENTSRVIEI